jgi:hypothetical protein
MWNSTKTKVCSTKTEEMYKEEKENSLAMKGATGQSSKATELGVKGV